MSDGERLGGCAPVETDDVFDEIEVEDDDDVLAGLDGGSDAI